MEFLFVLPVLLLVFFAIVELSRAWLTFNLVTTAVREGVRVAAVTDPWSAQPATNRITAVLDSANLTYDPNDISVTCAPPCEADSAVTADAIVTFQTVVPIILPILDPLTIQQSATMRYE